MPNAIYNYVYYEPLQVGGPVTRQNRNPATSSKYVPVPGIVVPPTNDLATGSVFTPDLPPQTYSDGVNTYNFGFMNVSGCVGAGETSTDYANLPGSASFQPLIVGSQVINILVVYIIHGGGGGGVGGGPGIYLDAFDETTGAFLDNFFVTGVSPDGSLTSTVNVYGSLAVEPHAETLVAATPPINTPGVANSLATFDKWVKLEGPAGNPVISGNSTSMAIGGSTSQDITAFAFYKEPASVYITGSYLSPDILLFTPFSTTSLGTEVPIGSGSSTVIAGVNYGFAAIVHNDSEYEVSTNVTFWNIPGGAGTLGVLLDTQNVIIPATSSVTVFSSMPFINTGTHTCAVVSLNTPDTKCQFSPTSSADSIHIPSPVTDVPHSCTAWRNTNTISVFPGGPFHFGMGFGDMHEYAGAAIEVEFQVQHAAADFARDEKALEIIKIHKRVYGKVPPYLIPSLRERLPSANLKPRVNLVSKGKVEDRKDGNGYALRFENKLETAFEVSGVVPENAKPGDTYLVHLTAHYPKTGRLPAKSIGFTEILLVKGK